MEDPGGRHDAERRSDALRRRRALVRRRRAGAAAALVTVVVGVAAVFSVTRGGDESAAAPAYVPRPDPLAGGDPLAYDSAQAAALTQAAAFGLSHPLYTKSPGGVLVAAQRTASFRPLIDGAVAGTGFDAATVEAIVFLESGGRPNVIAGDDPARASGLTQILAETAKNFLGMKVNLAQSRKLTAEIAKAAKAGNTAKVARLQASRRSIDDRFDPALALAGTLRYLETALQRLGRPDLAVVSYHMGIGNLTNVLRAYTRTGPELPIPQLVRERGLSWVRVFFDSRPAHNIASYRLLKQLGDDSPTYYWRVLAAKEIMRLYRNDRTRLSELATLQRAKASAEEALHPPATTERFVDASDLEGAWENNLLQRLPNEPATLWFTVDPTMGELAGTLGQPPTLYRGLRAEALATLTYIAARVHQLSGATQPLQVTSTVRDEAYQRLLRVGNPEATGGYSLHTTGFSFDIRRRYQSPAQATAFQFLLDDLRARGLIAWVREPAAIHVTVASAAKALVPAMLVPAPE